MHMLRRLITLILLMFILSLFRNVQDNQAAEDDPLSTYLPVSLREEEGLVPIGPEGGSIVVMEIDPTNTNILYAGSWGTGMYKSLDGGGHWFLINQGLDYRYINSLAMDPTNPLILYAGTYEGGVYKTTDGGATWAHTGPGLSELPIVYTLAVDPVTPNVVYAGTRNQQPGPPWGGALYKSTDGGANWVKSKLGISEEWVYDVKIDPADHNTLYVATHSKGVFKSVDAAAHWAAVNKGITDLSTRSIVIDPTNTQIAYVGTWHYGGVFKTTNGGKSWIAVSSGLYSKIYSLHMDPWNTNILYAATYRKGLMVTTNAGTSWHNTALYPDLVYNVMIDPTSTQVLYAGTMGDGFYKSWDRGATWISTNWGLKVTSITGLVAQWSAPVSSPSPTAGKAQTTRAAPITSTAVLSDTQLEAIYASVYGGWIAKSTDRGQSWQRLGTGLGEPWVHALAISRANPQTLYAGLDKMGFFISYDGGINWASSSTGLLAPPAVAFSGWLDPSLRGDLFDQSFFQADPDENIYNETATSIVSLLAIAEDYFDPNVLFVGTEGLGVFRSQNGGARWATTSMKKQMVYTILSDPFTPSIVYAGCDATSNTMYLSTDDGLSWQVANWGMVGMTVYALAADPVTPGTIYAGTSNGVYLSPDNASGWYLIGLEGQPVTAVGVYASNPATIFAGTSNNGLFVSENGGVDWKPLNKGLVNDEITSLVLDPGNAPYLDLFGTKGGGVYRLEDFISGSK